jgi:hypothetical protein
MSTSTCVRKHLICELQTKEYCTCMMVLWHILVVLCEMFSVTPVMKDGEVVWTHCMVSTPARIESSAFLPVGTPKHLLCKQLLLTMKTHFITLWMRVRLSATAPVSLNGCGGP